MATSTEKATKESKKAAKAPAKAKESRVPAQVEPWPSLGLFRNEMDRLFDDFFGGFPLLGRRLVEWPTTEPPMRFTFKAPQIDFSETDDRYEISAELPGLDEKDIHLEIKDGMLILKGEKKEEREEKKKDYHVTERRFGQFQRVLRVPAEVREDKIAAQFKNGVLTVTLPKSEKAKKTAKKIDIKASV